MTNTSFEIGILTEGHTLFDSERNNLQLYFNSLDCISRETTKTVQFLLQIEVVECVCVIWIFNGLVLIGFYQLYYFGQGNIEANIS